MWHIMQHSPEILPLSGGYRLEIHFGCGSMALLKFPRRREGVCESVKLVRVRFGVKTGDPVSPLPHMDCVILIDPIPGAQCGA